MADKTISQIITDGDELTTFPANRAQVKLLVDNAASGKTEGILLSNVDKIVKGENFAIIADPAALPTGVSLPTAPIDGSWVAGFITGWETDNSGTTIQYGEEIHTWEGVFRVMPSGDPKKVSNEIDEAYTSIHIDRDDIKSYIDDTVIPAHQSAQETAATGPSNNDVANSVKWLNGLTQAFLATGDDVYIDKFRLVADLFLADITNTSHFPGYLDFDTDTVSDQSATGFAANILWMCATILEGPHHTQQDDREWAYEKAIFVRENICEARGGSWWAAQSYGQDVDGMQGISDLWPTETGSSPYGVWDPKIWIWLIIELQLNRIFGRSSGGMTGDTWKDDWLAKFLTEGLGDPRLNRSGGKFVWDIGHTDLQLWDTRLERDSHDVWHAFRCPLLMLMLWHEGLVEESILRDLGGTLKHNIWNGLDAVSGTGGYRLDSYIDSSSGQTYNSSAADHSVDGDVYSSGALYHGWFAGGIADPLAQHITHEALRTVRLNASNVSWTWELHSQHHRLATAAAVLYNDTFRTWSK